MPVYFEKKTNIYHLAVWHITEEEAFFSDSLGFDSDKKHPKRRLEHLSGRLLLKYLDPNFQFQNIIISPLGKPQMADDNLYFSISHSFPFAAAILSKQKSVGIDIQMYVDKIERLQHKFLSAEEQTMCANNKDLMTLSWCAKEALFKYYGLGAVDFKADMPILEIDQNHHDYKIKMILEKTREACILQGITDKSFAMAWL